MTTSFTVNRDQVINSALRLQGWLDYNATADPAKITVMAEALNIMLKAWSAQGMKIFTVQEIILPLVQGQTTYRIGPSGDLVTDRPLKIVECFLRLNQVAPNFNDIQLQPMSREEYTMLGNKSSQGVPNSYYYDAQIPNGVLYIYLTPDLISEGYTVHLWRQRLVSDINGPTDNFDFPQEWFQALRWGLAAETSLENQCPPATIQFIEAKAEKYINEMVDWDQEPTSIFFMPDARRGQS
jgi:hypothetical protein